jgi:hypothetical protein
MKVVSQVSRRGVSGTGRLRRLPPRVQRPERDPPHPGCFAKRGCKLLKTKDGSAEKSAKSDKEAANCCKQGIYRPDLVGAGRDTESTETAKAWTGNSDGVTPRGSRKCVRGRHTPPFCMDVKTRGLLEKGFVRL